jgi:hypothetical protein
MTSPHRVFMYVLASLFELLNQLFECHEIYCDHYAMKGHLSLIQLLMLYSETTWRMSGLVTQGRCTVADLRKEFETSASGYRRVCLKSIFRLRLIAITNEPLTLSM